MEIAMMEAAGSVKVQIVRSTRAYVKSVLVMVCANTALTIPVIPALRRRVSIQTRMNGG